MGTDSTSNPAVGFSSIRGHIRPRRPQQCAERCVQGVREGYHRLAISIATCWPTTVSVTLVLFVCLTPLSSDSRLPTAPRCRASRSLALYPMPPHLHRYPIFDFCIGGEFFNRTCAKGNHYEVNAADLVCIIFMAATVPSLSLLVFSQPLAVCLASPPNATTQPVVFPSLWLCCSGLAAFHPSLGSQWPSWPLVLLISTPLSTQMILALKGVGISIEARGALFGRLF